jgi:hypothetical protein
MDENFRPEDIMTKSMLKRLAGTPEQNRALAIQALATQLLRERRAQKDMQFKTKIG